MGTLKLKAVEGDDLMESRLRVNSHDLLHAEKHNDLVYDVGICKGEDTYCYLRAGFRVIGFEADPDLVAYCKSRFSEEIDNGRLILVEGAVIDECSGVETVEFYKNKKSPQWGTIHREWARRNGDCFRAPSEMIHVKAVNFVNCLAQYGIPYYLKVDIEGSDLICVRALSRFAERPTYLSIESDKRSFSHLVEDIRMLRDLGYGSFKAIQQEERHAEAMKLWRALLNTVSHNERTRELNHELNRDWRGAVTGRFGEALPGDWKDCYRILEEYKRIFQLYAIFGDQSFFNRHFVGKALRKALSLCLCTPMPGWYDTHARLAGGCDAGIRVNFARN